MQISEKLFAEMVGVLVAGLLLFMAVLRYIFVFMKGQEKHRLELFDRYEAALTENVKLKGRIEVERFKQAERDKFARFYQKTFEKYQAKELYKNTLDKPKTE